jgi:hypothetical protein
MLKSQVEEEQQQLRTANLAYVIAHLYGDGMSAAAIRHSLLTQGVPEHELERVRPHQVGALLGAASLLFADECGDLYSAGYRDPRIDRPGRIEPEAEGSAHERA